MSCNGICHRYKNLVPVGIQRCQEGRKRCNPVGSDHNGLDGFGIMMSLF